MPVLPFLFFIQVTDKTHLIYQKLFQIHQNMIEHGIAFKCLSAFQRPLLFKFFTNLFQFPCLFLRLVKFHNIGYKITDISRNHCGFFRHRTDFFHLVMQIMKHLTLIEPHLKIRNIVQWM